MKKIIALFFVLYPLTAIAALPPEPKAGDVTTDRRAYVLAHSEFPEDGVIEFNCSQCSAMRDLVFVASAKECGNASCGYFIFKKQKKSFTFITEFSTNAGGFQFLKTKHHAMNDILDYHHMSASDGVLSRFEFDGSQYKSVGKGRTILSADFEKYIQPEDVKREYFSKEGKEIFH